MTRSTASRSPTRILFVCLGNICRSPAAEGVAHAMAVEMGLDGAVEIDSAGTGAYHVGEPADPRMRATAEERGYELTSRARQAKRQDFYDFHWIVAMDRDNLRDLAALRDGTSGAELRLLSDFLPEGDGFPVDVPDPYYGGARGFERVLNMLEAAIPRLLEQAVEAGRSDGR